jgi:uncharacterized damage-inducible protein DinB
MKEQLLNAWNTHHKMNRLLLDNISDEGLQKSLSTRGGRTIYLQWIHVHNVRMQWLEICAKDIFNKYKTLDKEAKPDRRALTKALDESSKGLEELFSRSWDDDGKVKSFKKGLLSLFAYFVSHESHHRGNIMLTLKQCGEKISDNVKWGIWEWNK